jgi:hypothetical protein
MQTTIKLIQKSVPLLRSAKIEDIFMSTTLAEYDDLVVQISEEMWPDVFDRIKEIEVTLEEHSSGDSSGPPEAPERVGEPISALPATATASMVRQGMIFLTLPELTFCS